MSFSSRQRHGFHIMYLHVLIEFLVICFRGDALRARSVLNLLVNDDHVHIRTHLNYIEFTCDWRQPKQGTSQSRATSSSQERKQNYDSSRKHWESDSIGWSGVKWVTFSNVFLISRNLLKKWRILRMVMDIVCFLYYHEKGNCLQKDLCRGQPSFLWTGKWPILPHPGGVKWVTYFFFNNIHNFFISSDQFLCISKKRIVLYYSWAKSFIKWQILLSYE